MPSKILIPLLASGLLLAACASDDNAPRYRAGGGHHHPPPGAPGAPSISPDVFLFLPYDADHDRRITKAELNAAIAGDWRQLAAGREFVSQLDLQSWFKKIEGEAAAPFNALEFSPDDNGTISRDQFALALTRRFEALDANKDGVLEPSEFMTVLRMPAGAGGGQGGGPGGGSHRHRGGDEGGGY